MTSTLAVYVSHINEGLQHAADVQELYNNTSVRSLNLHGNNIQRTVGLDHLTTLNTLNLSSNSIRKLEHLSCLVQLTNLNLASNCITELTGLAGLKKLQQLNVSFNSLTSIAGITVLHGDNGSLQKVNLQHNQLSTLQSLAPLAGCLQLQQLKVGGNPATLNQAAYAALRLVLPHVQQLDDSEAASLAVSWQMAHAQLQAFQQSVQQLQQPEPGQQDQLYSRAAKKQARETQQSPRALPQQRARPLQAAPAAIDAATCIQSSSSGEHAGSSEAVSTSTSLDVADSFDLHQQRHKRSSTLDEHADQQHLEAPNVLQKHHRQHRAGKSSRSQAAGTQAPTINTGAQTDDYTPPIVDRLKSDAQMLREQMAKLIGGLVQSSCVAYISMISQLTCQHVLVLLMFQVPWRFHTAITQLLNL